MTATPPVQPSESHRCPLCLRVFSKLRRVPRTIYGIRTCSKCRNGFANRRQSAFLIDFFLAYLAVLVLDNGMELLEGKLNPDAKVPVAVWIIHIVLVYGAWFLFAFKDGFSGMSLGKALLGVQVVDQVSLQPIGFAQSFKRNLPLLPFVVVLPIVLFIPGTMLMTGPRWGDKWSRTSVIWRKYRFRLPFDQRGLFCLRCGYNLTGNTSGRCPECGTPIPTIPTVEPAARSGPDEGNAAVPPQ